MELSSNWKALQKKLEATAQAPLPKRKAADKDTHNSVQAKKRKIVRESERSHLGVSTGAKRSSKSEGKHMYSSVNGSRARSISAPSKPSTRSQQSGAFLKHSASNVDLKAGIGVPDDHTNEGNSITAVAGKYIALDCEMVGIGPPPHNSSQLARVSLVNFHGDQIYDSFVLPKLAVTDYRTHVSGITPVLLSQGRTFEEVQADVGTLLQGRILVGHAVKNDLTVLMLGHPRRDIRDTSRHKPFRDVYSNGGTPSLRLLAQQILGWDRFQKGAHSSVEDARATMMLFKREKDGFEAEIMRKFGSQKQLHGSSNGAVAVDDIASTANGTIVKVKKKKKKKKSRK